MFQRGFYAVNDYVKNINDQIYIEDKPLRDVSYKPFVSKKDFEYWREVVTRAKESFD